MKKIKVCLSLALPIYEAFKQMCKRDFSTISREVNLYMLEKIKKEGKNVY